MTLVPPNQMSASSWNPIPGGDLGCQQHIAGQIPYRIKYPASPMPDLQRGPFRRQQLGGGVCGLRATEIGCDT